MMVAKKAKVNRIFREKDCGVGSRLNRKGNMGSWFWFKEEDEMP
jgi:hypothetical protein